MRMKLRYDKGIHTAQAEKSDCEWEYSENESGK